MFIGMAADTVEVTDVERKWVLAVATRTDLEVSHPYIAANVARSY